MKGSPDLKLVARANDELRKTRYEVLAEERAIFEETWTRRINAARLSSVRINLETAADGIAMIESNRSIVGVERENESTRLVSPLASMSFWKSGNL